MSYKTEKTKLPMLTKHNYKTFKDMYNKDVIIKNIIMSKISLDVKIYRRSDKLRK